MEGFKRKYHENLETCEKYQSDLYSTRKRLKTCSTKNKELKEQLKNRFAEFHADEKTRKNLESLLTDDILGKLAEAKLKKNKEFDLQIKEFAMSLHFYSPKVHKEHKICMRF